MSYQPVIGLEVHIELNTNSKMFCSCKNDPLEKKANVNICPVCTGQPGSLPVINREAVKKVIKTGLALNCQILKESKFDRKNYFYPDLPKGYQISQYDLPLCKGGYLELGDKKIRITRVHLEEDTGKLLHPGGADYSLVDFNRAGVPLMELVTEPDLRSAQEAKQFAQELRLILRYLEVSEADMEKGQMRLEANISLTQNAKRKTQDHNLNLKTDDLGTKVEIKNLNSFVALEKALEYEIERQAKVLASGKKVVQETRGWDDLKGETVSQREKEEAQDYRYFPEPDLPPLWLDKKFIDEIRAEIPELPYAKRLRFEQEYKLPLKEIEVLVQHKALGQYFEQVVSELQNWIKEAELKQRVLPKEREKLVKLATNYLLSDLQGLLLEKNIKIESRSFLVTPENFAELITLIYEEKISSKIAKQVLAEMFKTGVDPSHIIEEKELSMIEDDKAITAVAKRVLENNEQAVEDFKRGREQALQFLVGEAMRETQGRANPAVMAKALTKILKTIR